MMFFTTLLSILYAPVYAEDLKIDLRYEPTAVTEPSESLFSIAKQLRPVKIGSFIDKRTVDDAYVGEVRMNGRTRKVLSNTPLSIFTADVFRKVFDELGGKNSPQNQLMLNGEITQFRFEDAVNYQAKVGFHFLLQDENGNILWDGHASGVVRGGRALTQDNLSVIISDVLRATYAEMLEDNKLVGVWSGKGDLPSQKVSQKGNSRSSKKTMAKLNNRQKRSRIFEVGYRQ